MNRLVALGAVLAFISVCHTAAAPQISTVVVDHGIVGVGVISGGTFGPGSFSIGRNGSSHRGQTHVDVNEDGGSEHSIFIQATNHKVQQDNRRPQHDNGELNNSGGINSGNTQLFPVKPLTTLLNTGQEGIPGQGGSEGGSIFIGGVVPPNHENNKFNKQPDAFDASTIEDIYASNTENNGFPSAGVAFSSGDSIAIGITGGNFGQASLSFNNKRPGANVPQQQITANNGDIGHQTTGHEAPFSISVYSPDASVLEAIFGSNSRNNALCSTGNGGQGSVAIGAITGGYFGEGTWSLNNKKPEANVPQQQSAANNRDIGHQNTENKAPFSMGHGVSVYSPDASALEAIFGSNSGNNEHSNVGNGGQGSVAIGAITGGHFSEETLSLNNKKPEANVPQQQSSANNGDIGHQNTGNEAPFSIAHGVSVYSPDPSALEAIFGSNSGNNELSSTGNGGQGSVAIGAITGGHFGEETLSLNNKKPGTNVPQLQRTANNENTEYHNTGNEAPRSVEHGGANNGNGNAGVGYNDGQSSTGYNAYKNEKLWIWHR